MESWIADAVRTFIVALLATAVGGSIAGIWSGKKVVKEQQRLAQEDKDLENLRLIRKTLIEVYRSSVIVAERNDRQWRDGEVAARNKLDDEIVLRTTLLSGNYMPFKGKVGDYRRLRSKATPDELVQLLAALIKNVEGLLGYPPGTGHLEKNAE